MLQSSKVVCTVLADAGQVAPVISAAQVFQAKVSVSAIETLVTESRASACWAGYRPVRSGFGLRAALPHTEQQEREGSHLPGESPQQTIHAACQPVCQRLLHAELDTSIQHQSPPPPTTTAFTKFSQYTGPY